MTTNTTASATTKTTVYVNMSVREMVEAGKYTVVYPKRTGNKEEDHEMLRAYRDKEGVMNELFQRDLQEENGIPNTKPFNGIFVEAWDHGHSAGYIEVIGYYEDLVQRVIDPLVKAGFLVLPKNL